MLKLADIRTWRYAIIFCTVLVHICECARSEVSKPDGTVKDAPTLEALVSSWGYDIQFHSVTTEDGYILGVFRLPARDSPKASVYLQHGILASSASFLANKRGLPYFLRDQGYDVWVGNARGTRFSREHVKHSEYSQEYWNFSFHEMGIYDIPAILKFITDTTHKPQVHYIGHSMGTTMFLVMASCRPEKLELVRSVIFMAPVARPVHMAMIKSPLTRKFLHLTTKVLPVLGMTNYKYSPVIAKVTAGNTQTKPPHSTENKGNNAGSTTETPAEATDNISWFFGKPAIGNIMSRPVSNKESTSDQWWPWSAKPASRNPTKNNAQTLTSPSETKLITVRESKDKTMTDTAETTNKQQQQQQHQQQQQQQNQQQQQRPVQWWWSSKPTVENTGTKPTSETENEDDEDESATEELKTKDTRTKLAAGTKNKEKIVTSELKSQVEPTRDTPNQADLTRKKPLFFGKSALDHLWVPIFKTDIKDEKGPTLRSKTKNGPASEESTNTKSETENDFKIWQNLGFGTYNDFKSWLSKIAANPKAKTLQTETETESQSDESKLAEQFDECGRTGQPDYCTEYDHENTKEMIYWYYDGTSIKNHRHFLQIAEAGRFQKFDYEGENKYKYGKEKPPKYHLRKIKKRIYLLLGGKDDVAQKEDIEWLHERLENSWLIEDGFENFDHSTFNTGVGIDLVHTTVKTIIEAAEDGKDPEIKKVEGSIRVRKEGDEESSEEEDSGGEIIVTIEKSSEDSSLEESSEDSPKKESLEDSSKKDSPDSNKSKSEPSKEENLWDKMFSWFTMKN